MIAALILLVFLCACFAISVADNASAQKSREHDPGLWAALDDAEAQRLRREARLFGDRR